MISLKIRSLLLGIALALVIGGFSYFFYDYYHLRQQHQQILFYLIQPVRTDAQGNPVQRAQALDELIPKEQRNVPNPAQGGQ